VLGLVQAAHRFDPAKGVNFNHYAAQRIRGAILDAVRSIDWAPRSVRRAGRVMEAAGEKVSAFDQLEQQQLEQVALDTEKAGEFIHGVPSVAARSL
jgi:DNA-directed RNA polymerase specialized sigma subunit